MKPLKVLILITKANWGGAQRFVYDLATGLPKDRFSVEVMAGSEGPLTEKLTAAGIYASGSLEVGRDVSFFDDVKAAWRFYTLLRAKKPDVLHVNSSKIGGIGAFAGRLAGVPRIVFTVHGWAFNEQRPLWQKAGIVFLYWLTAALSHEVTVVSRAARAQASSWPFVQDKFVVIHNGIAASAGFSKANARLELCRMHEPLMKAVDGVSERNLTWIGTIAELHPVKGYRYAIKAAAECIRSIEATNPSRRVVYTIMGTGEQRERIAQEIRSQGLEDRIFLLGHVDRAAEYVKAFDIFLLASLSEALGYVLLEAGAAAVPVVATAVGGIPEVIDDMHSGILVQPRNSRDLCHALLFMTEHQREARDYGARLKEKVAAQFSLQKMIAGIEKAYTK